MNKRRLAGFIKSAHEKYIGRKPDRAEYARYMKQLGELIDPGPGLQAYDLETLEEVLEDLHHQGVKIERLGILRIAGLLSGYTGNRQDYQRIVEWLKAKQPPKGWTW